MKERPILFSSAMVRAILEGRKTQTRRVIKVQPPSECSIHYMLGDESWLDKRTPLRHVWEAWGGELFRSRPEGHLCGAHTVICPYGVPGDRLYVRETWCNISYEEGESKACILYRADGELKPPEVLWRPSIYMPRWASRITLEITDVLVQRVQEIGAFDALAEGIPEQGGNSSDGEWRIVRKFEELWDSINGKTHPWASNPWCWCLTFKRVECSSSEQKG